MTRSRSTKICSAATAGHRSSHNMPWWWKYGDPCFRSCTPVFHRKDRLTIFQLGQLDSTALSVLVFSHPSGMFPLSYHDDGFWQQVLTLTLRLRIKMEYIAHYDGSVIYDSLDTAVCSFRCRPLILGNKKHRRRIFSRRERFPHRKIATRSNSECAPPGLPKKLKLDACSRCFMRIFSMV